MRLLSTVLVIVAITACDCSTGQAAPILFGPSPYLSTADSPIPFTALEDFETLTLFTNISGPVVTSISGVIISTLDPSSKMSISRSNTFTDTVSPGTENSSFFVLGPTAPMGVEISFATPVASAGIVWTDTASPFSGQTVTFEAFGPGMVSLGTIVGSSFGDGSSTGGAAHVSEDRVFAVSDSMAGIIAIRISQSAGSSMELDHLLVGGAVSESLIPEPSTFTLLGIGCVALLGYRWRKRRVV